MSPDGKVKRSLSVRQEQFCREYLVDLNASRAAADAGYSLRTAKEIGYENLTKPHIQARLKELLSSSVNRVRNASDLEISVDRVLFELAQIAFLDAGDYFSVDANGHPSINIKAIVKDHSKAIRSIRLNKAKSEGEAPEIFFSFQDKLSALNILARYLQLFTVKPEPPEDLIALLNAGRERVAQARLQSSPRSLTAS